MKEVHQAIDILKGLQCIDGEYDAHRENELYKALRLLESFVEQKPVTHAATVPETSMAGLWADPAPVTVTIVNKSGVEEIPHESIETAMEELTKSMSKGKGSKVYDTILNKIMEESLRPEMNEPPKRVQAKKGARISALEAQLKRYKEDLYANSDVARDILNRGELLPETYILRIEQLNQAIKSVEADIDLMRNQ